MINLIDEGIRINIKNKELECRLEYDLIDAEEAYHITHRFPRRFDFLSGWERW